MINRRDFLKVGAVAAAGVFVPVKLNGGRKDYVFIPARAPQAILDPLTIPKYESQVVIPPAMPRVSEITLPDGSPADYYEITMKQFSQQVLPPSMNLDTPVWSFVKADDATTYHFPGFTIDATWNKPVRVKWINGLVDEAGNYLPHLLPVDQTLHWANPPGPRDTEAHTPGLYTGPVPMVVHVHGAHTNQESDGYPEAWYLPDAANIPAGYYREGTFYKHFRADFIRRWGVKWEPGTAVFQYPNDQRAATTWFHDHVLGITRLNVYAGPAAFFLVRGGPHDLPAGELPAPAPALGDPAGTKYYEIPLAIQDRSFNEDGTLFYPDNRAYFEGLDPDQLQIPFIPDPACDGRMSDVPPIWNPEFFGNSIIVNGHTWPNVNVEQRRYRLRLLNGCNSRFLILKLVSGDPTDRPADVAALPFWVIGNEGGFLPEPVSVEELLMSPAERFDVIVDFTEYSVGTELFMINLGPDEPFGGGIPGEDFDWADPDTTGQVMKFTVVAITGEDSSTPPDSLALPAITPLGPAEKTRGLSLVELDSLTVRVNEENGNIFLDCANPEAEPFGPIEAHLGTVTSDGRVNDLGWEQPLTETLVLNTTEIWELYNTTVDAHPIHVHLVHFEVVNRQALATDDDGEVIHPLRLSGEPTPPEPWEEGFKDTVIAYPGAVTRIKAKFDVPGLFVWHCHILEHEDNEMMRPYLIVPKVHLPIIFK